jgi:hypothetical protein
MYMLGFIHTIFVSIQHVSEMLNELLMAAMVETNPVKLNICYLIVLYLYN